MSGTSGSLIAENIVRGVLDSGAGYATLKVTSSSMRPCIEQGDSITISRVSPRALLPGDVVVFASDAAGLVVHRLIWKTRPLGRPTHIYTKGDAVACLDRSVPVDRIVGRVDGIIRGEGRLSPTAPIDRVRCLFQAAGYGARRWLRRWLGPAARSTQPGNLERR